MMSRKRGFFSVSFGSFGLPLATVHVQCRETRGVSQRVEVVVYKADRTGIAHGDCIELSVENTKVERTVLFMREHN